LESAAVYLRDTSKVYEAVIEARKGTDEGDKNALQLLYDSQTDIKSIASLWGLDFEVICDLLTWSPEGHPLLNGPYCGVFFSKDANKPFLGLAFKGTNLRNWGQVLTNVKSALMMSVGRVLWGSPVHTGYYQTMFLKFPHIDSVPLDYIKNMIDKFLNAFQGPPIYLHCTGHSLGGAYATLCFSELMRLYNNDPTYLMPENDTYDPLQAFFSSLNGRNFILRDLYTFGCPRVGGLRNSANWAKNYKEALNHHEGKSWRVVNKDDPCTKVPPGGKPGLPGIRPWNHIDSGYEVDESSPPRPLPTEIDTEPWGFNPLKFPKHFVQLYFKNLLNASSTGAPQEVEWIPEFPENVDAGEVTWENVTGG